ncbi:MAG: YidC/Oxa1 family insertase periplasmic-domain containing protein [bacterium]
MEKRMILAIVLSMAVIMIFSYRSSERMRQEAQRRSSAQTAAEQSEPTPEGTSPTPAATEPPAESSDSGIPSEQPLPSEPWDALAQASENAQEATLVVESKLWRVEFSNRGAVPISWRLLQYQEVFHDLRYLNLRVNQAVPPKVEPRLDSPQYLRAYLDFADYSLDRQELDFYNTLKPILDNPDNNDSVDRLRCAEELVPGEELFPASPLVCRWGTGSWDTSIVYEGPTGVITVGDEPVEVAFTARGGNLQISKIFTFNPDLYAAEFRIRVENVGDTPIEWGDYGRYRLTWQGGLTRPSTQKQRLNSVHIANSDGDILHFPKMPTRSSDYATIVESALKENPQMTEVDGVETLWRSEYEHFEKGGVRWTGIDTKYFLGALRPHSPLKIALVGLSRIPGEPVNFIRPAMGLELPIKNLLPGAVHEDIFDLYVGPKEGNRLTAVDETLEELVQNYWLATIVSPIARLLLHLLQFFYQIVPNYGVGIILLTFLVRLLMYPLYHKQMASMKKMQALQPQINALKERYKESPQELQKKTMEFYREHKVNPMAGCLTMLPTLPIFIALWGTFNQAIELRGAPFIGWIQDLSQPDQAFFLPIAGRIIPINILPIIYCVLMLWSQSRQKIETPNAGMMKVIPIVFVFFFWSIASGVILYFVVSMTVDTLQRIYIDKFGHHETPTRAPAGSIPERVRKAAGRSKSRRKR